jgi:NAD(P)-dependent dehydrogenase (short-subunit alcohol dehydrogenase family)
MNIPQKGVIVTGGSSGIGLGAVRAYLDRGYGVVANSRAIDAAALERQGLPASPRLVLVPGDVSEEATAQRITEAALQAFGRIDVLVNNAGIFIGKPFTEHTPDEFERLLSTNLRGFFHVTQRAVRQMLQQGGGSIVTISAAIADQPQAALPGALSVLTKAGLNAATRALALELAPKGIRVNAVAPGVIDTPLLPEDSEEFLKSLQPTGRIGRVEDIVNALLYLTESPYVTGQVLHVDGGMTAGRW